MPQTESDPRKAAPNVMKYYFIFMNPDNSFQAAFSPVHPLHFNEPGKRLIITWQAVSATEEEFTDWMARI